MSNAISTKDRTPESAGFRSFFRFFITIIAAIIIGGLYWYANQLILTIRPDDNQHAISWTTYVGDKWNIEFTHSVQKTPVEEFFVVRGPNDLLMEYTRYQSLGVGLPYLPSEGKLQHTEDGRFILEMNRPFQNVKLRTALEAKHRIFHDGKEYALCELYSPGSLVEITVEKRFYKWF